MAIPKDFSNNYQYIPNQIIEYGIYSSVTPYTLQANGLPLYDQLSPIINGDEKASADYIFPHIVDNLIYDGKLDSWYKWNVNHWEEITESRVYVLLQEALNISWLFNVYFFTCL